MPVEYAGLSVSCIVTTDSIDCRVGLQPPRSDKVGIVQITPTSSVLTSANEVKRKQSSQSIAEALDIATSRCDARRRGVMYYRSFINRRHCEAVQA